MDPIKAFEEECEDRIARYRHHRRLNELSNQWVRESWDEKYSYNFKWMGRPIIQLPQDIVAMQEIIWTVKPDLIVETGIAHGGSLVFSASMLELIGGDGQVIGIDIDIRNHNREEIEKHPMAKRITMVEGDSIDSTLVAHIRELATGHSRILVFLDSCHELEHVLAEMRAYSPLVSVDSYLVVFDTIVENLAGLKNAKEDFSINNPKAAVREFLSENPDFIIDETWNAKLQVTHNPSGFLKRIR